jgi:hypothetical protein
MTSPEPVHRDEDSELLGFLIEGESGMFIPCTLFGYPLGPGASRELATDHLTAHGLSYLAAEWELLEGERWLSAQIVEANPVTVTVRLVDYGSPDTFGSHRILNTPLAGTLRLRHRGF